MASLQFEECSYADGHGGFKEKMCPLDQFKKLEDFLQEHFPMVDLIEVRIPYLYIWCDKEVPALTERPFMVAGLVGLWFIRGQDYIPRELDRGSEGNWNIWLDAYELASDLKLYHIPTTHTLRQLLLRFSTATAIGFLNDKIWLEFPRMLVEEFENLLEELPGLFRHNAGLSLQYYNGERAYPEFRPEVGRIVDTDSLGKENDFVYGRWYAIDSFVTIPNTRLLLQGKRVIRENKTKQDVRHVYVTPETSNGQPMEIPIPENYHELSYGIYATSDPTAASKHVIQAGFSGTAITKANQSPDPDPNPNIQVNSKPSQSDSSSAPQQEISRTWKFNNDSKGRQVFFIQAELPSALFKEGWTVGSATESTLKQKYEGDDPLIDSRKK